MEKKKKLYCVANAHLDTQWNWTIQHTIRDCVKHTLEDNFTLFEKYPEYVMNFEGAFRYKLAKEYYPEQYEKLKKYVREGRWNVAGSQWDASDVNVPSSEALMRQILYGNGFFEAEFGKKSADIFLTDCFGFRYSLPSIAAHMGLKGFSTQKLVWGVGSPIYNKDGTVSRPMPDKEAPRMDLGKWIGPDGNYVIGSFLCGDYTKRLGLALHVKGLLNIQFVVKDGEVFIIEVNPRSSRTVPFLSKVTDIKMVNLATRVALGHTLKEMGYHSGLVTPKPYVAVKAPVFSFAKMTDVDIALGPEMKSTGEVMGIDYHYARALYKAILGSGIRVPLKGRVLFTVANKDKEEMKQLAKAFYDLGFQLCATEGTARAIQSMGIDVEILGKVHERSTDIIEQIKGGKINLVINTLTQGQHSMKDGFHIRRATVEHGVACLTSLDTAWEVLRVLSFMRERRLVYSLSLQDYVGGGDDLA